MSHLLLGHVGQALQAAPTDPRAVWRRQARPDQLLPPGQWRVCYWQGGRGSGKNRSGAGAMAEWVLGDTSGEGEYGIIAPTYADAWTKCVEGESGLLAALGTNMGEIKDHKSRFVRSAWRTYGQVIFHNGIIVYIDSAAEGGPRIQGRNLRGAWCDEIGLWEKWETAWNESLKYAVRKGGSKIIVTGTPKISRPARRLIRSLLRDEPEHGGVVVRRLRTIDNAENLSPEFLRAVIGTASGTRLERQELEGELLDDVANALWTREMLEGIQVPELGEPGGPPWLRKVWIGVDPSDGNETSDEQAYTVTGLGENEDKHAYVAESWGGQMPPVQFAERCIDRALWYREHGADVELMLEKNHGGEWLMATFRQVLKTRKVQVKLTRIHASQAKRVRAEPVSALYARDVMRHCGPFVELEDQMATFTGAAGERSPDRLDSLVWSCDRLLRQNFGATIPAKFAKYAKTDEEKAYPDIDDLTREDPVSINAVRRLASAHGIKAGEWALEDFEPQDDPGKDGRTGSSGNAYPWR